ncbi:probable serine hydrolase [Phlebotomus argentipes]|uniref:probable serine hydrolase n=1 Tax=Phlebotomus argentipes TaxID=94469 RepID=UPI0028934870|nr:probable serine hydrolase [Phlebotomus argentipes]
MNDEDKKPDFTEVKIKVPWGHVAGKWWGPSDVRPILLIHGWLDNAGTFDTLIPLLPKDHVSYLAIDLPGHGLSSHIPEGMTYSHYDYVWLIHRIRKIYEWDKISLIGHSLGGVVTFLYTGIFSKYVDMLITLDGMKPYTSAELITNVLKNGIARNTTEVINHLSPKSQPAYSKHELTERMQASSYNSLEPKDCEYLFIRGIKKSPVHPDKYFLRSDARVKVIHMISFSEENSLDIAREVRCPVLRITADIKRKNSQSSADELIEALKKNNKQVEHCVVSGKHHVHLSQPDKISGIITDFILKYRSPKSKI